MTRDEREALKDLAAKATPGPWRAEEMSPNIRAGTDDEWFNVMSEAPVYRALAPISEASPHREDATLIAAARTAVPSLLRDLETAEGLLREVEWRWRDGAERECLYCHGLESEGHAADCRLAAFLGEQP